MVFYDKYFDFKAQTMRCFALYMIFMTSVTNSFGIEEYTFKRRKYNSSKSKNGLQRSSVNHTLFS